VSILARFGCSPLSCTRILKRSSTGVFGLFRFRTKLIILLFECTCEHVFSWTHDNRRKADQGMNTKAEPSETFGPFTNVRSAEIFFCHWACTRCRRPVRRFATVVPDLVPRILFFACKCGCVATFEDERRPTKKTLPNCVRLLRESGAGMLVFNGDKPTPAGFQGVN
jgi:hypothetical protein